MGARRSCLSVPGSSERMLVKAAGAGADEVVLDLEDSVAPADKEEARRLVAAALAGEGARGSRAVRVNGLGTPWWQADLAAVAERADAVVLPKVERAEDVARLDAELAGSGAGIQALVETAGGLLRVGEIAGASARLQALVLGYEDLAASLGRPRGREDWLHAQESVLVAARAEGRQAIDGPYLSVRDEPGLRRRAERARDLGYDGKWAVHPAQVVPINEVFTPGPEEVERADAVLAALDREGAAGAVEVGGAMVDEASRKLALFTVERARAARS